MRSGGSQRYRRNASAFLSGTVAAAAVLGSPEPPSQRHACLSYTHAATLHGFIAF